MSKTIDVKIGQEVMNELKNEIKKDVAVKFVRSGDLWTIMAQLQDVIAFERIVVGKEGERKEIPFIDDCAIISISDSATGEMLYKNDAIDRSYKSKLKIEYKRRFFGDKMAKQIETGYQERAKSEVCNFVRKDDA